MDRQDLKSIRRQTPFAQEKSCAPRTIHLDQPQQHNWISLAQPQCGEASQIGSSHFQNLQSAIVHVMSAPLSWKETEARKSPSLPPALPPRKNPPGVFRRVKVFATATGDLPQRL